jgi:hypothetical protein
MSVHSRLAAAALAQVDRIKSLLDECLVTEEELVAAQVGKAPLEDPMFADEASSSSDGE